MSIQILGLDKRLLTAISELGFTELTEIQEKAIPVLLTGDRDLIGLAQTGTGKTAAFGLPLIQAIDVNSSQTQGLILCPTRELCLQITQELKKYSQHVSGVNIVAVYGGTDIKNQIKDLRRGAHIVVGTPGRLLDHISRRTISLENVGRVILDEADQMFDMGFQEDIDTILASTPKNKRIWLFSATMQPRIEKIAHTYMHNPLQITIGSRNSGARNIEHLYCIVKKSDTYAAVRSFIDYHTDMFGIIFCATKKDTQEMASRLMKDGYNADSLSGDLSQAQRDSVMKKFRNKQIQVLIATDIAARGIDVDDITHVIHCNIPDDIENYTHRSGRTARAGKSGMSILVTTSTRRISYIEQHIGGTIARIQVPTSDDICKKQVESFTTNFINTPIENDVIKQYAELVESSFEGLTKEDLIKRIFSRDCAAMLKHYSKAQNINIDPSKEAAQRPSRPNDLSNRLSINIGKIDRMNGETLIKFICNASMVSRTSISRVSMQNTRSFFTAQDSKIAQTIIKTITNTALKGRRLRVEHEMGQQN